MLADRMLSLFNEGAAGAFVQQRSRQRAAELALGGLCALGRRTISRSICAIGRQHQDWSADYKLYSRSPWKCDALFEPVLRDWLRRWPTGPVSAVLDDTKLPKSGRRLKTAFWQRDPMSPPFHVNLIYGLRFMQASLIFPHYREGDFSARALPARFVECPAVKKPGKRATDEQRKAYRLAVKTVNLSWQGIETLAGLRGDLDRMGQAHRPLLASVDGSFCNRTVFRNKPDRTELVARCRKDARLCWPAPAGTRRKYSEERFTPQQARHDDAIPWRKIRIHYAGTWREIRYKELKGVLWRRGSGTQPLRLFVIAPQPYQTSPHAPVHYRDPAYLLATCLKSATALLLQSYFDRWQIEVNHREEKQIIGVGEAQVWSPKSVPRQPAFAVAAYSLLVLAALQEFGPGRPDSLLPALPKWRKNAKRASALDLITLLRGEINETSVCDALKKNIAKNIVSYAYT